jgi:hypothetical protein
MKHAGEEALDALEDLLAQIRQLEGLQEKKRGIFYRRSTAFLHFHEDPAGLFADLRVGDDFQRFSVNTKTERKRLVQSAAKAIHSLERRRGT